MSINKYNATTGELTTLANGSRIWIGTKAAHDAAKQAGTLPTNCLIAITDDSEDNNYSTEEVITGKFWIDGKPIYRKCCMLASSVTVSRSDEWQNLLNKSAYGLSDIDCITASTIIRGTHKGPVNGISIATGTNYIQAHSEYISWTLDTNSVIVLEYTKVTD